MTPATELVGTVLDGKLRIERLLASGAAGDVYQALHLGLGTHVAVKVLRPGGGETASIRRRRFLREARVAARLRSPHVVRVFDVIAGEGDNDLTYIVMELLEGETLAERLQRDGPLPIRDAVEFMRQAAHALGEMHDAGMIHRDVKPSNLFLEKGADGVHKVKLLDFGVAALRQPVSRDSGLTFSEAFIGTPRYMAPEQVRSSKSVDARADVWALAVTLHELLAGAPPFDGLTVIAILNQIERGSAPPLEQLRPEVPSGLVALLRRCMSREPDDRPANARALGEALEPFGDRSDRAAPVRPAPTTRRLALVAAMVVAVTFVVLLGLRRPGDARPSAANDVTPAAPSGSAASVATVAMVPNDPAPAPSAAPAPSSAPSHVDAPSRPRPRPAPARPPATTRPPRETDDRIE
jgi:eukaryotic-like serine/threonine-protein kinase